MADNPWRYNGWTGNIEGLFSVEFTNGDIKEINVSRNLVDAQAFPIYLERSDGTLFNWKNIISITKKDDK